MPTQIMGAPRSHSKVERIAEQVLLAGGQLLVAGILAIMWQYIARTLGWDESAQFPLAPAVPQIRSVCVIAMLGFFSALSIFWLHPGSAAAGRWVWLPPAALLALLIAREIFGYGWDWHMVSARYFWTYPYQKIAPIERDIFTYPTLSALAYSLGVQLRVFQCRSGGKG